MLVFTSSKWGSEEWSVLDTLSSTGSLGAARFFACCGLVWASCPNAKRFSLSPFSYPPKSHNISPLFKYIQYTSVWFCLLEFPALVTLVSDKRHHQDFVSSTSVTQGLKMQQTRTQTARDWWTQRTWERHSRNAFKGSDSSQVESREMHKLSAADRVCPSKASISNWPSAWIYAVKGMMGMCWGRHFTLNLEFSPSCKHLHSHFVPVAFLAVMLHNASCFPALYSTLLSIYRQTQVLRGASTPLNLRITMKLIATGVLKRRTAWKWHDWQLTMPCHALSDPIWSFIWNEQTCSVAEAEKQISEKKSNQQHTDTEHILSNPKWNGQNGHVSVMVVARHQIGSCIVASCGLAMMRQRVRR